MRRPKPPRRPAPVSSRGVVALGFGLLACAAWLGLDLSLVDLVPGPGGRALVRDFFAAALEPAWDYEAEFVPSGAPAFALRVLQALLQTLIFAACSLSLALVVAVPLGLLASSAWWRSDPYAHVGPQVLRPGTWLQVGARVLIAALRSVHELFWALILLAATGFHPGSGVIALAVPYVGILAKVFSELIDEASDEGAFALAGTGAPRISVFLFGRLPYALPDMAAYTFYRLECCVRSSAVLGFFGFETLGYYLGASFENAHFREVWTYLYSLFLVVILLEVWSGRLRRRFVA